MIPTAIGAATGRLIACPPCAQVIWGLTPNDLRSFRGGARGSWRRTPIASATRALLVVARMRPSRANRYWRAARRLRFFRVVRCGVVTAPTQRRVLAVASNKGGVGKTTIATNLAITLRALHEELPILVVTLDDQASVERLFRIGARPAQARTLRDAFAQRSFAGCAELGEFGVHFVPPASELEALKVRAAEPFTLRRMLDASDWRGLVVLDTKSDLEALTRSALAACDLAILPVADRASLDEAARAFELLAQHGGRRERGRVLFTLVDRRTKLDDQGRDLYQRLCEEAEARGWPRFATYLSRSPRVEALISGQQRPRSLLHEAKGTLVHKQLRELAEEVSKLLGLGERSESLGSDPNDSVASRRSTAPPEPAPPRARDLASGLRSALFRGLRGR
jgi:cellulose biosynthesis protein BcsQ